MPYVHCWIRGYVSMSFPNFQFCRNFHSSMKFDLYRLSFITASNRTFKHLIKRKIHITLHSLSSSSKHIFHMCSQSYWCSGQWACGQNCSRSNLIPQFHFEGEECRNRPTKRTRYLWKQYNVCITSKPKMSLSLRWCWRIIISFLIL